MNPVLKLSLIRWMGDKAKPEDREGCVADGVDVLQRLEGKTTRKLKTNTIVDYFLEHNLKLLTSDKEGGFVVLPEALYKTKAKEAIQKNFKPPLAAVVPQLEPLGSVKTALAAYMAGIDDDLVISMNVLILDCSLISRRRRALKGRKRRFWVRPSWCYRNTEGQISYDDDLKCITGVVQASMRNKSYVVENGELNENSTRLKGSSGASVVSEIDWTRWALEGGERATQTVRFLGARSSKPATLDQGGFRWGFDK
ncbi:hypothetical protein HPB47_020186 [Ixodes persulcatus]|uniref:Uncharacterized protein n=1 Tax=Ixodes persulcatus TaxID=34615 RepID=A0AC60QG14_IXOPE|nr:hypothetical protein HPB47_020186 [Ixodes persulcatus]